MATPAWLRGRWNCSLSLWAKAVPGRRIRQRRAIPAAKRGNREVMVKLREIVWDKRENTRGVARLFMAGGRVVGECEDGGIRGGLAGSLSEEVQVHLDLVVDLHGPEKFGGRIDAEVGHLQRFAAANAVAPVAEGPAPGVDANEPLGAGDGQEPEGFDGRPAVGCVGQLANGGVVQGEADAG